jgi:urease accessory protein
MYDGTSPSDRPGENNPLQRAPSLQRAKGRARISVSSHDDGRTRLQDLYQSGCAKVRLPKAYGAPGVDAVLLNTAGGLTGGDVIETEGAAGDGTVLTLTTQACERVYRSTGGEARVETRLSVGKGARLKWLPQETILFDGGRLTRRLEIDLEGDSVLLAVEPLILGRGASGETVQGGLIRDSWRLRRNGNLIFADETRIEGAINEIAAGPAVLAGARAVATVVFAAPDAGARLDLVRGLFEGHALAGASALDDRLLVCRLAAPDGQALREILIPLLTLLRGADLPRAWYL